MYKRVLHFIFAGLLLTCCGCNAFLSKVVLGIDRPTQETEQIQRKYAERLGLKACTFTNIRPAAVQRMIGETYKEGFEPGFKPLQVRTFDPTDGRMKWQYASCEGRSAPFFADFPPRNIWPVLDSNRTLLQECNDLSTLEGHPFEIQSAAKDYDLVIVVYWAKYFGKPGKWLLKAVRDYLSRHPDKRILVVLANVGELGED